MDKLARREWSFFTQSRRSAAVAWTPKELSVVESIGMVSREASTAVVVVVERIKAADDPSKVVVASQWSGRAGEKAKEFYSTVCCFHCQLKVVSTGQSFHWNFYAFLGATTQRSFSLFEHCFSHCSSFQKLSSGAQLVSCSVHQLGLPGQQRLTWMKFQALI